MDSIVRRSRKGRLRPLKWVFLSLLFVIVGVTAAAVLWYFQKLRPVDTDSKEIISISIVAESTPTIIGQLLEDEGVIQSQTAFWVYTRLQNVQSKLQAGEYEFSPSESTNTIVDRLVKGSVSTVSVTFFPGATLVDNTSKTPAAKQDISSSLRSVGYTDEEIQAGLRADYSSYNSTLFQGRPSTADLEGYIYGDTYIIGQGASVEAILRMTFDEYWRVIQENNLVEGYKKQGLSLFEGITLASIVQREAIGGDEPQIAQVFFSRLSIDMELGSDVTYQYIADKTGVPRDPLLKSPYNTRVNTGLTPGPIATPGRAALLAVASPADTDYLFFLSGDDNVTYFGKTLSEHEANIRNHCATKCQIL